MEGVKVADAEVGGVEEVVEGGAVVVGVGEKVVDEHQEVKDRSHWTSRQLSTSQARPQSDCLPLTNRITQLSLRSLMRNRIWSRSMSTEPWICCRWRVARFTTVRD